MLVLKQDLFCLITVASPEEKRISCEDQKLLQNRERDLEPFLTESFHPVSIGVVNSEDAWAIYSDSEIEHNEVRESCQT